jgi:predicted deacylase
MSRPSRGVVAILALLLSAPAASQELMIIGEPVAPGESRRIALETSESFVGGEVAAPVIVVRGIEPGPVLCLTGGIHGDELNGVEIVRRVADSLDPMSLHGMVIALPIVNPHGFRRSSRYLPDRRDLNRFFPGRKLGSAASRIARRVFEQVIMQCDYLIDFHTGSFHRTNLPHLRGDLSHRGVVKLADAFAPEILLNSVPRAGILRGAAVSAGIPAVTFEAGEPMRFDPEAILAGVDGVKRTMAGLQMSSLPGAVDETPKTAVYRQAVWVRVDDGGILLPSVPLGANVEVDTVLATVTDPITNQSAVVTSPYAGRIIGMAHGQVVIPGFAAFRIALEAEVLPEVSAGVQSADGVAGGEVVPAVQQDIDPDLDTED